MLYDDTSFKKQIIEDIQEYQQRFPKISNINKYDWAFNFWILATFFNMDEELIEENICDYNDKGIDCYYYNDSTNDLYIIQNKFYGDTPLSLNYVKDDFLIRPINWLESGSYKRSEELQKIWNQYSKLNNFTLHLELYISNNQVNDAINYEIKKFVSEHKNVIVEIFTLDKIKEKYYGEIVSNEQYLNFTLETINKGTVLNINTKDYKINNPLDAKYVFAPVITIYRMRKLSYEKGYPLFNENIREYLGNKGINKKIYTTLMDENERKNFFYYNNGITMICDDISKINTTGLGNYNASITIKNPQIVNGCQTVNSIYEALSMCNSDDLEEQFKDCFVMVKILKVDQSDENSLILKENIVRYNNSQNSIDEKTFVANNDIFKRVQKSFETKGFLLLIKQSDKNMFTNKYKTPTKLKEKSSALLDKYGLDFNKTTDFTIKLEKLLQVIISFIDSGYSAFVNKPKLLKPDSKEFNRIINFITNDSVTMETLLELYLLYAKAEKTKKNSNDGRTPIVYYLINAFSEFECKNGNANLILEQLGEKSNIEKIIKKYSIMSSNYCSAYQRKNNIDYNKMIKKPIDREIYESSIQVAENVFSVML